ncbi:MAG TPA: hypothetical protein DCX75_12025 [Brevundimonas sp.]|nr:hypothetical protein [Brevundimonas sp.]HAV50788.1 hypothetical protein [Brevundimonas sp.]
MRRSRLPPGVSFSLSRATGLVKAKRHTSDQLGVPLRRQARQRKLGASLGCCVMLALPTALFATAIWHVIGG